jgi:hypothetical protein
LPSPGKLAKEGHVREAAEAYCEKASVENDVHKQRRFLNFAGRYYETAGEFSLSARCFLESGDVDRALGSAMKSENPKVLSNGLTETGHKEEETAELLLRCALKLTEQKDFVKARAFVKEASDLKRSPLAETMIGIIDGLMENKSEKVTSSLKAIGPLIENDPLAREMSFVANELLSKIPKAEGTAKEPPTLCPECGAPLPQKRKGRVIECEYCGFPVRLD